MSVHRLEDVAVKSDITQDISRDGQMVWSIAMPTAFATILRMARLSDPGWQFMNAELLASLILWSSPRTRVAAKGGRWPAR
jgi:hypothetical protein